MAPTDVTLNEMIIFFHINRTWNTACVKLLTGILWPNKGNDLGSKRPKRGPRKIVPINAATPAVK